jgi:hypothetical protein
MLGIRYKSNTENNSELEINNFYNYGLLNSNLNKIQNLSTSSNRGGYTSNSRPILSNLEYKLLLLNKLFRNSSDSIMDTTFLKLTIAHYCIVLKNILGSFFVLIANNFKSSILFYF